MPELNDYILPVDFSKNKRTKLQNIETAKKAKKHLQNKGSLIIFPAGGVSVAKSLKSEAKDEEWKLFPAKLIQQTKSDILPIYFDGKNGLLFHLFASKIKNQTLKYSSYKLLSLEYLWGSIIKKICFFLYKVDILINFLISVG